ncbi:MAG: hypothetical protein LBG96_06750 [Tannerella sp.]|jgi:hypothetical protein|nr:hypothetical protein [Tannerella sp.]
MNFKVLSFISMLYFIHQAGKAENLTIKNRMRELLDGRDRINVPAEVQGRDNDVSQTKTQSGQAFPTVNQTQEGRLPL